MNRLFPARSSFSLQLPHGGALHLGARVLVMGVLNVTPDSFANAAPLVEGDRVDVARAVETAVRMEADGADLIDVGGESTRPGAAMVPARQEIDRVVPVIEALARRTRLPISVDTSKSEVAQAALDAGAALVNDVSGLKYDPAIAALAAEAGAPLVLMHMRGRPQDMYAEAAYEDLMGEVADELRSSIERAVAAGVPMEQIIVDPGIGFAKRAEHSYGVLAQLPRLADALGRPLLVGPSRKSFMRAALGERPAVERDWGTAAAITAAVLGGAHIVRVHAVAEMTQVVRVAEEIRKADELGDRPV